MVLMLALISKQGKPPLLGRALLFLCVSLESLLEMSVVVVSSDWKRLPHDKTVAKNFQRMIKEIKTHLLEGNLPNAT